MKITLIILLFGICLSCWSQSTGLKTISLDTCYDLALQNYPKIKNRDLYKEIYDLKINNIKSSWLPVMDISGQITHQSDVINLDIDIDIPGFDLSVIPEPPKTQYKVSFDIKQTLYDGGISSAKSQLEKNDLAINQQQIEVEFKQLKQQVNNIYFLVLIFQETEKQLNITCEELENRLIPVHSAVRNGMLLSTEEDKLKAEILRLKQSISEITHNKIAGIKILSKLIDEPLVTDITLIVPGTKYSENNEFISPELRLADLQLEKVQSNNQLLTAKRLPKLWAFGQYGFGKPSLNVLDDKAGDLYILGVGLNWNIWDWNITKREREMIKVQEKILKNQKESIEISHDIELRQENADIKKYKDLIKKDMEIIKLQENIRKTASSQLNNGVITSTDYIREVNAETQAKIKREVHKIKLEQAKLNYITIKGEL